jgi:predicted PurR-regulated permease PerM
MPTPLIASYILAVVAAVTVLCYDLLVPVLAGLTFYVLTMKLASHLPTRWGRKTHGIAFGGIILIVVLLVLGSGLGLWLFFQGQGGMPALLSATADQLDNLKKTLPSYLAQSVPDTVQELRGEVSSVLRQNGKRISHVGMSAAKTLVEVILGMVVGGIIALHRKRDAHDSRPLAVSLTDRMLALTNAFERVVFAQVKISALNTALTAIYLFGVLPLCGVQLPMRTVLVLLTFVTGLLPIVGNLISNTIIVLISLGNSLGVGLASVGFLLLVHKLEYFTNAKIVGGHVDASIWELLSAMILMEALFGIRGLVAAPIAYAWLKSELKAVNQV